MTVLRNIETVYKKLITEPIFQSPITFKRTVIAPPSFSEINPEFWRVRTVARMADEWFFNHPSALTITVFIGYIHQRLPKGDRS
jgi:hypothetical protein